LLLLEALHMRWSLLLRSLNMKELQRSFVHPETKVVIGLDESIGAYAWHGKHHLAHIKNCIGLIEDSKK